MQTIISTPIGPVEITAKGDVITGTRFLRPNTPASQEPVIGVLKEAADQLTAWFSGEILEFSLPLDVSHAEPFVQRVCAAMLQIPRGETRSYGEIATMIDAPGATQAVGNAAGANPVPIIIPCHRVIRADGSLGGYSGPTGVKRKLLSLEGVQMAEQIRLNL